MAVYATPTELRAILTRDAQHPEGTAAEMPEATLQLSIDAAQGQVDARLANQYTVPFDPTPDLIKAITLAIAAYLADLGYRQSVDSDAQDPVARRYQWANDMLSRLSTGSAVLPGAVIDSGMFPINRYEGVLFTPDDFSLNTGRTVAMPSRWAGPWD